MLNDRPMIVPGSEKEPLSAAVLDAKMSELKAAFALYDLAVYPGRWQGKRVAVLAERLGPNEFKPLALLLDSSDMMEVDVTEAQTVEGLVVDDSRIN